MTPRSIFDEVFSTETTIALIVFVLVFLAILVALWLSHRRKRRGDESSDRHENNPLEIAYGVLVAAVAGFVIYLSLHTTSEESAQAQTPAAVVNITGYRWCWRFAYPGHGITLNGTCDHFRGEPVMVIPAGEPVQIHVTSEDVIHSWFVPALRYKLDGFPNHVNTATLTADRIGEYEGRCAEFCGEFHYTMDFRLRVVSPDDYQKWLSSAAGQAG